jgi:integrase
VVLVDTGGRYDYCMTMASVHKDPRGRSPYWYALFYGADGRRKFRSTKSRSRTGAMAIAVRWEDAARRGRKGEITAAQARKVLAEIVEMSTGESLTHYTATSWFSEWLTVKVASATESTMTRYRQVLRDFETCLGPRSKAPLPSITPGDVAKFRDHLSKGGRAPSTVNMVIKKILSVPFEDARRRGYILSNPVQGVDAIKGRGAEAQAGREPFSGEEINDLLQTAEGDWRGAILCAVTTGLRLGDVAGLTWGAMDDKEGVLRVIAQKTGATVAVPIHPDFAAWLAKQERGIGKAPVFSSLHSRATGGNHGLSRQFRAIMDKAGITGRVIERKGAGRTGHSKSFHALRHSFVSDLANAGVAADLRQKLAGHADEKVHAAYTHHELETLRSAISKLPRRSA